MGSAFFTHLDDNFSYKTVKFVDVKDWRLGVINNLAMFSIALWVLGYTILYSNAHLAVKPIYGSVRLTIQQPTKSCNPLERGCESDFSALSSLRYCQQYSGSSPAAHRLPCKQEDGIDLAGKETTPGNFFVPTMYKSLSQSRATDCGDTCKNVWGFDAVDETSRYVPDLSRFTLLLDHGYFTIGDIGEVDTNIAGEAIGYLQQAKVASHPLLTSSLSQEGDVEEDGTSKMVRRLHSDTTGRHELENRSGQDSPEHDKSGKESPHGKTHLKDAQKVSTSEKVSKPENAPKSALGHSCVLPRVGHEAPASVCEGFPSAFSLDSGDVISIGDLIKLADPHGRAGSELLDVPMDSGKTLREAGAVLMVVIQYMNGKKFDPLGKADVRYVVSASLMPMGEYKRMYKEDTSDTARQVHNVHGLLIQARVQGRIKEFAFQSLLVQLTTAMALLAFSVKLTDTVMLYVMSDRDKFKILKFQPTQHFKELRDFQAAQVIEMQARGQTYDELEQKPCPVADFLSDIFEDFKHEATFNGVNTLKKIEQAVLRQSRSTLEWRDPHSSSWQLDILATLIRHEQRLNRVDGMDEHNLGGASQDRMAKFYRAWEDHYWSREGWNKDTLLSTHHGRTPPSSPEKQKKYVGLANTP